MTCRSSAVRLRSGVLSLIGCLCLLAFAAPVIAGQEASGFIGLVKTIAAACCQA